MRFQPTALAGAVVVELDVIADDRGGFARAFCEDDFAEAGLPTHFPQTNLSYNTSAGTLRGLHFNAPPHGEGKFVRAVRGGIRDVIVDVRTDSPTRFEWIAVELTAENGRALYIPPGFAHGFITLADQTDVHYHMTSTYVPEAGRTVRWDDSAFGIDWGRAPTVMSAKDRDCPSIDASTFELETY